METQATILHADLDAIRERFGRDVIGYAAVALDRRRSVPDAFRELAEKDLGKHED